MSPPIVLSFDNLGEATELERGTWDGSAPLGRHPSVTVALPRLLDALDGVGLRATFFVEAINCELNPRAVREIVDRGHELGAHGWRHEPWTELDDAREADLLTRADLAYAELDVPIAGFRPPGGELRSATAARLRALGYRWCSPAGGEVALRDGLAEVPFAWELVDAYHLMESFADLRVEHGDPAATRSAVETGDRMRAALAAGGGGGSPHTVVMHPFLMLDDAWWAQVRETLAFLAERRRAGELSCRTVGEQAEREWSTASR